MKVKLLIIISFFTSQFCFSQTEKLLHGKVISQNNPLKKVEVINKTAKRSTTTNDLGEFDILVSAKDSLLFFSKNYFFKRFKINTKDIETNNLLVEMILKPEELDEVLITKIKFEKIEFDPEAINKINIDKTALDLTRFTGVNDGRIRNSANMVIPLRGIKPKDKNEVDERFKKLAKASCPPDFFTHDLKLNPEEKELFLEFCDADPRSKTLLEHPNVLSMMDFLYAKNEMFKKLK